MPLTMKALRIGRPSPASASEILIRLALHMLELAGTAPFAWCTVAEAAEALGCDKETVRWRIRHKQIEAYFDRRFLQYAIPRAELERLLAERGRTMPDDFASTQSPLALLPLLAMTDDNKITRLPPLSAKEKDQLNGLLRRIEDFRAGPIASELREQRHLEAERERLAQEERKAAEKLAGLQSKLDEISERLLLQAKRHDLAHRWTKGYRPGLQHFITGFTTMLAKRLPRIAKDVDARELTAIFEAACEDHLSGPTSRITLDEYFSAKPPGPAESAAAAAVSPARHELDDDERIRLGEAILASGRKRRGEPEEVA